MARTQKRIVNEMVIARIHAALDEGAIVTLQSELVRSIDRALELEEDSGWPADRARVAQTVFRRAWRRVGEDLSMIFGDAG